MSLLEDVFLQDEAGEAQELERVIEGDEYDERPRSLSPDSDENSEKEDEAVEDKRRVDPAAKAKRVVKNPRFILNPARLTGPRGIQILPEHFKDFKFKGKGHEKEDLDFLLKKLEHWAYRLYPKFKFEDCLKKIETLGKKRPVMVHLHKIRSDQFLSEETVVQKDSSDDEAAAPPQEEDEFDKLLQQQIELARATPAPASMRKPDFSTPSLSKRSPLTMPKATSSPSISGEQKERMIRNRQLAEERRLARLKQNTSQTIDLTEKTIPEEPSKYQVVSIIDSKPAKKSNRSNVIDSSDEDDISLVKQAITVDIHDTAIKDDDVDITKLNHDRNSAKTVNSEVIVIDLVDNTIVDTDTHKKGEKRNRLNVIDSSDDECNISAVNQAITIYQTAAKDDVIDITKLNHDRTNDKNINKEETVIDLVDNAIVNKDAYKKVENRYRSDAIDSSDEDCDISAVNQAITVKTHNKVTKDDFIDITKLNHDRNNIKNINTEVAVIDLVDRAENKIANKDAHTRVEQHNRSNVIISSDEECDISSVNQDFRNYSHDTDRTNLNGTENDDIEMSTRDAEIAIRINHLENEIVDVTENNVKMQRNDNFSGVFNPKGNENIVVKQVSIKNNNIEMQVQQSDTVKLNKDCNEERKEKSIEIDGKDNVEIHHNNNEFDSNSKDGIDKLEVGESMENYEIKNNQFEQTSLEVKNGERNIEHCTTEIQELNSVEDLMDVDFSEDF